MVQIKVDPVQAMIEFDLRGNIDNVDCGYNQSEATATSAVLAGLFNSLRGDVPRNAGAFRRIHVLLREGAVVGKPKFPHSCSVATTNVSDRMVNLTGAAFAQLGDGEGLAEGGLARALAWRSSPATILATATLLSSISYTFAPMEDRLRRRPMGG